MTLTTKERQEITKTIQENKHRIVSNRNNIEKIKKELIENHGVLGSAVERTLNDQNFLEKQDLRETILVLDKFHELTKIESLSPKNWFTSNEIKTAMLYDKSFQQGERLISGYTFKDVTMVTPNMFSTYIDIGELAHLLNGQFLEYDFNIQREAKKVIQNGQIIRQPYTSQKNIDEMEEKLLAGKLKPSTIVFNATVGSSPSGEELQYNRNTRELIVNEGFCLAILDGYHRCVASLTAYQKNQSVTGRFILTVTNFTVREAQEYQADHAKATPISKERVQMFELKRYADLVTQSLMSDSELKGRVAGKYSVSHSVNELVSYSTLTDAIEKYFKIEFRRDVSNVADYLGEFFDELIASFPEEFTKPNQDNLMAYNKMFVGYVYLASEMKKHNISVDNLYSILKNVNFNKDSHIWEKYEVVENGKLMHKNIENKIVRAFKENINLGV